MLSPAVFYVSFFLLSDTFFRAEFLYLSNIGFLWFGFFLLLMIMVRSYYVRILAFATNHLILYIFLQHFKVLKHLFFLVV